MKSWRVRHFLKGIILFGNCKYFLETEVFYQQLIGILLRPHLSETECWDFHKLCHHSSVVLGTAVFWQSVYSPHSALTAYYLKHAVNFRPVSSCQDSGLVHIDPRHHAIPNSFIIKQLNYIHRFFCPWFRERERKGWCGTYF